jgi:hypothetical protein
MNKMVSVLVTLIGFTFPTLAQVHSHGEGQLLISQDDKQWLVQFILPAADVFGFEHAPESPEQRKQLAHRKHKLQTNADVINLGQQCVLDNTEIMSEDRHGHAHDHHNIEFLYHFTCQSQVNEASVKLFDWAKSLHHLQVRWFTSKGQGVDELSSNKPDIKW